MDRLPPGLRRERYPANAGALVRFPIRRVIYKKGLIRRQTNEMNMDKVESVQINQSILGRLLDYGDVTILGTGEGFETLRTIASPIELRNSITGTAHVA
jgi:uncharacterized membrane protein YdbT with pleckstrin-like domain